MKTWRRTFFKLAGSSAAQSSRFACQQPPRLLLLSGTLVYAAPADPEGVAAWQPYRNLLRIRADGTEVWRAELPGEDKSFTGARLEGGDLIATAWRHRCTVDPATGHLVDTVPVD